MPPFPKIILVFLGVDWPIYSRRRLLFALSEASKKFASIVVAINRPLCPVSTVFRKPHRVPELLRGPGLEQLADNLFLFSPKYFIHDSIANSVRAAERLNLAALRASYDWLCQRLKVREDSPIVWYNFPEQAYVSKLFEQSLTVFELYDPLLRIDGEENQRSMNLESSSRSRVDLLVTVAHGLHSEYAPFYRHSFELGNGVDRLTYESLGPNASTRNDELDSIPQPRIGHAGVISRRLNWTLVHEIASHRPGWNFVFVGRVADPKIPEQFTGMSNVHFLPQVNEAEIAGVVSRFDVGILPYLETKYFSYLNPLKFYELAAAGVPIVTVRTDKISELNQAPTELVRTAIGSFEDWIEAIETQLNSDKDRIRTLGRRLASMHLWEDKVDLLLEFVAHLLAHRTNQISIDSPGRKGL